MKSFLIKSFFFIVPLIILIVITNYFIDPANLFNNDYENGLAETLHSGKNAAGVYDYNERIFQKLYIEKLDEKLDIAVLGSSRSLQIREEFFDGARIFNHGVSGAVLEDYIAITEIYKQKERLPKKIILGLNPWIFNRNNIETRWKSIDEYYYSFFGRDDKNDEIFLEKLFGRYYKQLWSTTYFQASVEILLKAEAFSDYYSTNKDKLDLPVKRKDGSLVYEEPRRLISREEAEIAAQNYIRNGVYSLENFDEIDREYLEQFTQLIDLYENEFIEIVFYLPPYHPLVYNYLKDRERYNIVFEIENYLNEFAAENNIKVVGSYNYKNLDLTEEDFHDGMHPKERVMNNLFRKDVF